MTPPLELVATVLALLAASFAFSGTQAAFLALQKPDRERMSRGTPAEQQVGRLLQDRTALMTSFMLGNETANVAFAAVVAGWIADGALGHVVGWTLLVATPFVVLLGDATPGLLGRRFRREWAPAAAWPVTAWYTLVAPVRMLFAGIGTGVARLLQIEQPSDSVAEEELLAYVDSSTATGELDPSERDIIEAVFEFDELTVERLMTPRPDVFSVPANLPWTELLQRCREQELSRVPITGQTAEDIVGLLLVKDLLKFREEPPTPRQLRTILLPPTFVPASKTADSMLQEFLAKRFQMAFVVDEHGTFVGLVTLDDLLRELLGSPEDEDEPEEEIEQHGPGALAVKASIDIEDFTQQTGIALPEGDYHTLGGFVFHQLGRLPQEDEAVVHGRYEFRVAEMEGRRVTEIVVTDLGPTDTPRSPTPAPAPTASTPAPAAPAPPADETT